jgi:ribosome modulation factor
MTDLYDRITCINRGYADYKAGLEKYMCPYRLSMARDSHWATAFWEKGWLDAERERKNDVE